MNTRAHTHTHKHIRFTMCTHMRKAFHGKEAAQPLSLSSSSSGALSRFELLKMLDAMLQHVFSCVCVCLCVHLDRTHTNTNTFMYDFSVHYMWSKAAMRPTHFGRPIAVGRAGVRARRSLTCGGKVRLVCTCARHAGWKSLVSVWRIVFECLHIIHGCTRVTLVHARNRTRVCAKCMCACVQSQ